MNISMRNTATKYTLGIGLVYNKNLVSLDEIAEAGRRNIFDR
ncbi:MAG: hypothetical protein QXF79_04015 [Ignisphaera sp.]